MNTLLKIAVGAAIAGAVAAVLVERRFVGGSRLPRKPSTAGMGRHPARPWVSPLEEVLDEHAVWGGGGSGLN
jgi:hypothetical protein